MQVTCILFIFMLDTCTSLHIDNTKHKSTAHFLKMNVLNHILFISERPTFQESLQPREEVDEGRNMTFSCAASGGPGITLSWTHNGLNLTQLGSTGSGKYTINGNTKSRNATSKLTVNRLRSTDSGTITCVAMVTVYMEDPQLPNVTPVVLRDSSSTSLSVVGK